MTAFGEELSQALDPVAAQAAIDASTCYWADKPKVFMDGGGESVATAKSLDVLMIGVNLRLDRIDPYRTPAMISGPRELPDGTWEATIAWYGFGD